MSCISYPGSLPGGKVVCLFLLRLKLFYILRRDGEMKAKQEVITKGWEVAQWFVEDKCLSPSTMSGSSQLPVTLTLGKPTSSSGLHMYGHMHAHIYTHK